MYDVRDNPNIVHRTSNIVHHKTCNYATNYFG
jgi:hypothetical protein